MQSDEDYERSVQEGIVKRRALRDARHQCPCCSAVSPRPLGGGTTCWWECWTCGTYSGMRTTWEEALTSDWDPLPWDRQGNPR